MKRNLPKMGPVEPPVPGPVPALLSCTIMPPARHVGTQTRSGTEGSYESRAVPYPGPFFVSKVAVRTVVTVRVRNPSCRVSDLAPGAPGPCPGPWHAWVTRKPGSRASPPTSF